MAFIGYSRMNGKYRNWCFTAYNKPIEGIDCCYICYQEEECPKTKKHHWQGYIEFENQKRMSEVKKVFKDNTIHLECRKGTQEEAIEYCKKIESKVGDFYECGKPKKQGNRTDIESIYDSIETGMTCKEILQEHRGKALRYIGCVQKALIVMHDLCPIDMYIRGQRPFVSASSSEESDEIDKSISTLNASEVEGNTKPQTEADTKSYGQLKKEYSIKFDVEKMLNKILMENIEKNIEKNAP